MAISRFALVLAGIGLLLGGFLAGQITSHDPLFPSSATEDTPGTRSVGLKLDDAALRKELAALTREIVRLRGAWSGGPPSEASGTGGVEKLNRAVEQIVARLDAGQDRAASLSPAPRDPAAPIVAPAKSWSEGRFIRLKEMTEGEMRRAHSLWTLEDVVRRYGHPDSMQRRSDGTLRLSYHAPEHGSGRRRYMDFLLSDGRVFNAYVVDG